MKKLLLPLLILFMFSQAFPQGIKFNIGGGLTKISGDLTNDISTTGFGLNTGWNLIAKARLSIPMVPFVPNAFIQYTKVTSSGSYTVPIVNTSYSVNTSATFFTVGVGGEIQLIPGPISPYAGLDLMYNNITTKFDSSIPLINSIENTYSRIGLGIGVGVQLAMIDVSVKYNMMNLIGKSSGELNINVINVDAMYSF
jgi:hypothetical protein